MGPDHAPKVAKKTAGRPEGLAAARTATEGRAELLDCQQFYNSRLEKPQRRCSNLADTCQPEAANSRSDIHALVRRVASVGTRPIGRPECPGGGAVSPAMAKFRLFDECRLFAGQRYRRAGHSHPA